MAYNDWEIESPRDRFVKALGIELLIVLAIAEIGGSPEVGRQRQGFKRGVGLDGGGVSKGIIIAR